MPHAIRMLPLALAAGLALLRPPALPAQEEVVAPAVPAARLTITPFAGGRVPIFRERVETLVVPGGLISYPVELVSRQPGGGVGGVEAELGLFGPVGIAGAFTFTSPDEFILRAETQEGALVQVPYRGPSVWFARAGLSYRLPEPVPDHRIHRPAGFLTVGPALVRESFADQLLALEPDREERNSWALHTGAKAAIPFGASNLAIHAGVENYAVFWNDRDREGERLLRALGAGPATVLDRSLGIRRTNVLMVSAGVSLRL